MRINSYIKVTIVEDDLTYIDHLKSILEKEPRIKIYEIYDNGKEFINSLNSPFHAHVYLVDLKLGDTSGLDCAIKLKERFPSTHVIIMTSHPELAIMPKINQIQGDIIEKGTRGELILDKIITSYNPGQFNDQFMILKEQDELKEISLEISFKLKTAMEKMNNLSDIQMKVLKLKAKGLTQQEISEILDIPRNTVNSHVQRALKKLDLPDLLDYLIK